MNVIEEIKDDVYKNLISYASQRSDAVMFIIRKDLFINEIRIDNNGLEKLEKTISKFEEKLKNSLLKKRSGAYWVYSKVLQNNNLFSVYFYKFDDSVKEYLFENNSFCKWIHPNFPEDIAFFKNGYCWLYSVAHEDICEIYYQNEEEYLELTKMGIKFSDKYFLSEDKRYKETY